MTTVRDRVLAKIDKGRQVVDALGLRRFSVAIRRRTWSGGALGLGTATNVDVVLSPKPRCRQPSARDVASSGGTFEEGDYIIDRITPAYTVGGTGGYTPDQLQIVPASAAEEVLILVTGDDGGHECTLVTQHFDAAFGYELHARPRRVPTI
jgi:hypothetical protein